MPTHFADKLILAPWALKQLGIENFDRLSEMLRAPEFEGWADDGGSRFAQQLIARLPKPGQSSRAVSDDQLRDYDCCNPLQICDLQKCHLEELTLAQPNHLSNLITFSRD